MSRHTTYTAEEVLDFIADDEFVMEVTMNWKIMCMMTAATEMRILTLTTN